MIDAKPLVTILTPVYNGEAFIAECIESVRRQTYQNWEYIIVNNCSTDGTLDIINKHASEDSRIRVLNNDDFVNVIENHNIAFQQLSGNSKYCKLVQADDLLFPTCIDEMVDAAESSDSIGIVGSYCIAGRRVECDGLPYPSPIVSGREVCRKSLLGQYYLFWSPSCLLIRSAIIRNRQPFYRIPYLHADVDALYEILQNCDFGFVHQVLTYIRTHEKSMTSQDAQRTSTQRLSHLQLLAKYGPLYLTAEQFEMQFKTLLDIYYHTMVIAIFDLKGSDYWKYQKSELSKLGYPLGTLKLMTALLSAMISNPRELARHLKARLIAKRTG
jgi:glycosyltransferase involved in cell wall biosynthesis